MLSPQDVVADTKGSFVSVKNTFKLWDALTYEEHGFAQNWSGWANH
jgi:hypothetical protein